MTERIGYPVLPGSTTSSRSSARSTSMIGRPGSLRCNDSGDSSIHQVARYGWNRGLEIRRNRYCNCPSASVDTQRCLCVASRHHPEPRRTRKASCRYAHGCSQQPSSSSHGFSCSSLGTLASLAVDKALLCQEALAKCFGLSVPDIACHTERERNGEVGGFFALLTVPSLRRTSSFSCKLKWPNSLSLSMTNVRRA
jgi:hypothetical protein